MHENRQRRSRRLRLISAAAGLVLVATPIGSAQAVDDARAMMTNAAEASITRWKIGGIVSGDSLSLINLATVEVRLLIRQDFQDLQEAVILYLVE